MDWRTYRTLPPLWQWAASTQQLRDARQQAVGYLSEITDAHQRSDALNFINLVDRELWQAVPRWRYRGAA